MFWRMDLSLSSDGNGVGEHAVMGPSERQTRFARGPVRVRTGEEATGRLKHKIMCRGKKRRSQLKAQLILMTVMIPGHGVAHLSADSLY
jgi:hypothetical protein